MVQKVLSIKVDPADWDWFKELAKGFNNQGEAFNALRQVYQEKPVYQPKSSLDKEVYQSVCYPIGAKLPDNWGLKTHKQEKKDRLWYVFPDDQVVAIKKKTANGSQSWLEVAAIYPSEVWKTAKSSSTFEHNPITALIRADTAYKDEQVKLTDPTVIQALSKGWDLLPHEWKLWGLPEIVSAANDYLLMVNQSEALPDAEVYQSVCDSQEPLATLTTAELSNRLLPKHLALSNTKTDKGRDNVLKGLSDTLVKMKATKAIQWTADRDPDGLPWIPDDEPREIWVQATAIATAKA
ncbi:MAG: hypothetical protein HEQ10_03445 [Dolichospermum sp. DEX182a]|nr:hypothetical protein [Dolichospermum sp. DEX182a]